MSKDLIDYFIQKTDARFASLEKKIDELLSFKWRIAGVLVALSFILTVGIQIAFKFIGAINV